MQACTESLSHVPNLRRFSFCSLMERALRRGSGTLPPGFSQTPSRLHVFWQEGVFLQVAREREIPANEISGQVTTVCQQIAWRL